MRSLFSRIAIRTAVGLYLGEHDVVVSKVAATPSGPVVVASSSERCTPEDLPGVIERLLIPLVGPKRRVPVAVGLANSRIFFGTGYRGRIGVFEVVRVTSRMADLIQSRAALPDLRAAAHKEGVKLLLDSGLDKVRDEVTSLEEVLTVAISGEEIAAEPDWEVDNDGV
jgi:hypothetical protein